VDSQDWLSRQLAHFVYYCVWGKAAAFAADAGDYAVGAAKIAAVLDFEDGARVVEFAALDWGGEEFRVGEDVAGQDLGVRGSRMEGDRQKKQVPRFARNDSFFYVWKSRGF
jgi:hypothetical protein